MGFAVILAIVGGLIGHHLAGGYPGAGRAWRATAYGAVAGLLVGLILPPVLGLVAALLHLVFVIALVAAGALIVGAILRAFL